MNRVLTLEEVLALDEGARVWVEHEGGWSHWDGIYIAKCNEGELICLVLEGPVGGGWTASTYKELYNNLFRVWSLPVAPTADELAAWPWEKGGATCD